MPPRDSKGFGSRRRRVTDDAQRTATTRNAAQYCRLVMPFCDATVSHGYLFRDHSQKKSFCRRIRRRHARLTPLRQNNFVKKTSCCTRRRISLLQMTILSPNDNSFFEPSVSNGYARVEIVSDVRPPFGGSRARRSRGTKKNGLAANARPLAQVEKASRESRREKGV